MAMTRSDQWREVLGRTIVKGRRSYHREYDIDLYRIAERDGLQLMAPFMRRCSEERVRNLIFDVMALNVDVLPFVSFPYVYFATALRSAAFRVGFDSAGAVTARPQDGGFRPREHGAYLPSCTDAIDATKGGHESTSVHERYDRLSDLFSMDKEVFARVRDFTRDNLLSSSILIQSDPCLRRFSSQWDGGRTVSGIRAGEVAEALRAASREIEVGSLDLTSTLSSVGDGLRLGLEIPARLVQWVDAQPFAALSESLDRLRSCIPAWPSPLLEHGRDDFTLARLLELRDRIEGASVAARRTCIGRFVAPESIGGMVELRSDIEAFSERLRQISAQDSPGYRSASGSDVAGRSAVTASVDPEANRFVPSAPDDAATSCSPNRILPPVEYLYMYLTSGSLHRFIEGFVSVCPEFASVLADLIVDSESIDPVLGLRALVWLSNHGPADNVPASIPLALVPSSRSVNESDEGFRSNDRVLGCLAPIEAVGRLRCTEHLVTLRVYDNAGSVSRIQFGDQCVIAPSPSGYWSVELPMTSSSIRLCVVGSSGSSFAADLRLSVRDHD